MVTQLLEGLGRFDLLTNPMLGVGVFLLYAVYNGVMLSGERSRPLHAISGLFATLLAIAVALVPSDGWWGFFVRVGNLVRYVGDPVMDGLVVLLTSAALVMAWFCLIELERPRPGTHMLAVTAARANQACLFGMGLGTSVYALALLSQANGLWLWMRLGW